MTIKTLTSYAARYTFSAKEKDEETDYSYFGARYYNSDLSVWLSVDPMSDKYPSTTPYAYCANNPVILVDPDGREVMLPIWPKKGVWTIIGKAKAGVGIGYGLAASIMVGVSFDKYGMTHWIATNNKYLVNQQLYDGSSSPAIEVGFDISLSVGFEKNYNYDSFVEANRSSTWSIDLYGKGWFGGSIGGGDDTYSFSFGVGISLGMASDPYKILKSISLSKQESERIGYSNSWTVTDIKYLKSTDRYQAIVVSGGNKTNIKVTCSSIHNKGHRAPSQVWISNHYIK